MQGSVWGSGLAGMLCAIAALATGVSDPWRIGFVASFVSKLSDTVSSEIGKVRLLPPPMRLGSPSHRALCTRRTVKAQAAQRCGIDRPAEIRAPRRSCRQSFCPSMAKSDCHADNYLSSP